MSQAQLDSARHPDLLSESIMSGATAKKESMTLCVQLKRWSLPYPLRKPGIGLLAAVTSLGGRARITVQFAREVERFVP